MYTFFDHPPTSTWRVFTLNVDQIGIFLTTYPPHLVHIVFERSPKKEGGRTHAIYLSVITKLLGRQVSQVSQAWSTSSLPRHVEAQSTPYHAFQLAILTRGMALLPKNVDWPRGRSGGSQAACPGSWEARAAYPGSSAAYPGSSAA